MIRFSNSSTGPKPCVFFTKSRITWILWGPQNLGLVGNRVPDGTGVLRIPMDLSSSVLLKRPERGGKHPISRQSQISSSSWVVGHVVLLFPHFNISIEYWYVEVPQSTGPPWTIAGNRASGSCSWRVTWRTSCWGRGRKSLGLRCLGPAMTRESSPDKMVICLGKMVRQPSNSSNYIMLGY